MDRRDARGFTLIELMVVILIIAILIGIAIPTFLGARARAQDRAAQALLRTALTAELTYFSDALEFTDSSALLNEIQPHLGWKLAPPADARDSEVVVASAGAGPSARVWLETESGSSAVMCMAYVAPAGVFYKKGAGCFADPDTPDPVSAGWNTQGF